MKSPPAGGVQMRLSAMAFAGLLAFASACDDGPAPGASAPGGSAPEPSSAGGSATSGSAPVESAGMGTAGDASGLASRVAARLDALPARTSLYARHLPSGREIAVRADEPMNALSVIKIPVMVLAYRDAEAGTRSTWANATRSARRT